MTKEERLKEISEKYKELAGHDFIEVCRIVGGNIWWNIVEKYVEDLQRDAFEAGRNSGYEECLDEKDRTYPHTFEEYLKSLENDNRN